MYHILFTRRENEEQKARKKNILSCVVHFHSSTDSALSSHTITVSTSANFSGMYQWLLAKKLYVLLSGTGCWTSSLNCNVSLGFCLDVIYWGQHTKSEVLHTQSPHGIVPVWRRQLCLTYLLVVWDGWCCCKHSPLYVRLRSVKVTWDTQWSGLVYFNPLVGRTVDGDLFDLQSINWWNSITIAPSHTVGLKKYSSDRPIKG